MASDAFEVQQLRTNVVLIIHMIPRIGKLLLINELRLD
jgi:hypothetical protein